MPCLAGVWPTVAADSVPVLPTPDSAGLAADEDMGHSGSEQDEEEQEPGAGGVPRKRVGRPLAYSGDPDAPHLTDLERRKIKR